MADVTLVFDNADGLLPVDYGVVELGRRLYRSGENDYLLNRQRVRLRDLVDLLDGAHLADNAFLFIGQGMVDQALALRPEERRPLFEEVAGVRRHERRRRKAEELLAESSANLARVEDILAELRPQARRLGQLAEQQTPRLTVGEELAQALLLAAHVRWLEAAARVTAAAVRQATARADAARAMQALEAAETEVAAGGRRSGVARRGRTATAGGSRGSARSGHRAPPASRAGGIELDAIARDRERIAAERATADADLATQRRALATTVPGPDLSLEAAVGDAERALAQALEELGGLRAASRARGDELVALRRAEAARVAEAETARRRLADAESRAAEQAAIASAAAERAADAEARLAQLTASLAAATTGERAATVAREAARASADEREGAARRGTCGRRWRHASGCARPARRPRGAAR